MAEGVNLWRCCLRPSCTHAVCHIAALPLPLSGSRLACIAKQATCQKQQQAMKAHSRIEHGATKGKQALLLE